MPENPLRHDYTRDSYKNGWAVLAFEFLDVGKAKMSAFGLKRELAHSRLEESYLLPGEEVVISMPDGEVLYEITKISYHRDPYDMYDAELDYIQHLNGFKSITWHDEKNARALEWNRQRDARRKAI